MLMAHSYDTVCKIIALANAGKSDPEIASELGLPRHGVRAVRRRHGIDGKGKAAGDGKDRYDWTGVDWSTSNAEIARQLGCHYTAVSLQRKKRFG
jgi:DNA-binding CsgD family transcriptional regulator